MKYLCSVAGIAFASVAAAVDMSLYQPSADVDTGFKNFLQQLYAETEDPASTTTFTDFFPADGSLIVLQHTAVGADQIVALKHALMPTDGSKTWNHMPNVTTVLSDSTASRVYAVEGVIHTTFTGGNCSQAYYSTRFTVAKDNGQVGLTARSGSLLVYDDFIVHPAVSPTDIPCETAPSTKERRDSGKIHDKKEL